MLILFFNILSSHQKTRRFLGIVMKLVGLLIFHDGIFKANIGQNMIDNLDINCAQDKFM